MFPASPTFPPDSYQSLSSVSSASCPDSSFSPASPLCRSYGGSARWRHLRRLLGRGRGVHPHVSFLPRGLPARQPWCPLRPLLPTQLAAPSARFALGHPDSSCLCWALAACQTAHLTGQLASACPSEVVLVRQSLETWIQKSPLAPCCCTRKFRILKRVLGPPLSWPFSTLFPVALAALFAFRPLCWSVCCASAHRSLTLGHLAHLCRTEFCLFSEAPSSTSSFLLSAQLGGIPEHVMLRLPSYFWVSPQTSALEQQPFPGRGVLSLNADE